MPHSIDKMKKIKNLKRGKGIQFMLNKAYEILGNPIYMHNRSFNLIACTENIITDDPIWNEFIETGSAPAERLEFYKNECFFDAAASARKITFMISDKLKYDRIFGKLFNKYNIQVCCAFLLASEKPFDDEDLLLFEAFCDILSKEISKDDFFQEYGHKYLDELIGDLINGKIRGKELLYTSRVESIYANLESNLYLTVVDVSKSSLHLELKCFKDLFQKAQPLYKYFIYLDYILIIVSTKYSELDIHGSGFNKLNRIFAKNNVYAGISNSFENLFELQKFYQEAVEALDYGQKNIAGQYIVRYSEIEEYETNIKKRLTE